MHRVHVLLVGSNHDALAPGLQVGIRFQLLLQRCLRLISQEQQQIVRPDISGRRAKQRIRLGHDGFSINEGRGWQKHQH